MGIFHVWEGGPVRARGMRWHRPCEAAREDFIMSFFAWTDAYDVGVERMNAAHRVLIDLMNRLHDLHMRQATNATMAPVFAELAAYTVRHFHDEEAHMASIGYPRLKSHALIHQDLLKQLGSHQQRFEAGEPLGVQFFSFLKLWLSAHIKSIDRQYSPASLQKAS